MSPPIPHRPERYRDQIPVAPIADAVQGAIDRHRLDSYTHLANLLWGRQPYNGRPDVTRLKRALGLVPYTSGNGGGPRTCEGHPLQPGSGDYQEGQPGSL